MSVRLSTIKENPENPRIIKDEKFNQLVRSLKDFPDMMKLRPIIVDENNRTLGGNMRLKALNELGYKTVPEEWIKKVKGWSEDQKREFVVKDNLSFGEWNWDELANNWDQEKLADWGLEILNLSFSDDEHIAVEETPISKAEARKTLAERFIIPPFSVFDTKQGYWQERKRYWLALGLKSELGRGGGILMKAKEITTENLNYYRKQRTLGAIPPNEKSILKRTGKYA